MISSTRDLGQKVQDSFKVWTNKIAQEDSETWVGKLKTSATVKLLTQFVGKQIPFATRNGFEVIELRPGYVKAFMPFKQNKNHFNAMYAGALFTVAELPGGILSILNFDEGLFPILSEYNIQYLKPAKTDVTVEFSLSRSELDRIAKDTREQGKGYFELHGEIKDTEGQVVAKTHGKYQVRMK